MRFWTALFLLGAVISCGGSGGDDCCGPPPGAPVVAKAGAPNGDGQGGVVASALADSFRVVVTESGGAKSGVTVNWTTTVPGASMSPSSSVTDASGRAASRMTLGQLVGNQTARASVGNSSVTFSALASAGVPAKLVIVSGDSQATLANGQVTAPLRVKVSDQFDNPINGSLVNWSVEAGNGNLSGATSSTAGGGVAAISLTAGATLGSITVRAVSAGQDTVRFTAYVVSLVRDVLVKNNFFESAANGSQAPAVDTIPAGEAIRWVWMSAEVEHNIISQGPPLFSGIGGAIKTPFTYGPIRIAAPGTYQYHCNLHAGMDGTIVVE